MVRYSGYILLFIVACYFILTRNTDFNFIGDDDTPRYLIKEDDTFIGFNLVDPESAPEDIRESVLRGYRIFMNTPVYAKGYARDLLSCGSCHLCEGNTLGGRDRGIALVGVNKIYPQYSERSGRVISLKDRINNCFERSMNGKAVGDDSQIMTDILTYLDWISHEVQDVKNPPWLGLKLLKSTHKPNAEEGAKIYEKYCVACHRADGAGGGTLPEPVGKTIPPLWGENSFNTGAGMNTQARLSSFVYWNMPYQNSILTEEQAIDVAAYVIKQPRPKFIKK